MKHLILILTLLGSLIVVAQDTDTDPDAVPVQDQAKSTLRAKVYYEDTGRPVKRMSVMLIANGRGGNESSGVTDGNGNLEIKNLRAGKYYAIVNAPGVVTPMAYLDFRGNGPDVIEQQLAGFPVIVVNGMTDVDAQIPARRGAAVSGRVTYSDGDAAIGVRVDVLRKVGDEFLPSLPNMSAFSSMMLGGVGSYQTDDRGIFRFAGLPAGEYIVKVTENIDHAASRKSRMDNGMESLLFGGNSMVSVFFPNETEKAKAQTIVVDFGQEMASADIVLAHRDLFSLEGKVVAAKDKLPIRNARISIQKDGEDIPDQPAFYGRNLNGTTTDEKGEWKFIDLPKGKYKLVVDVNNSEFDAAAQAYGADPSAANRAANAAAYAATAMSNSVRFGNSNVGPAKPPPPKFARRVKEFTLEDKSLSEQVIELSYGATVSGTVSSDDGKSPTGSVVIVLSDEEGDTVSTTSVYFYNYEGNREPSGKKDFRMDGVTSGKLYLTLQSPDGDSYLKKASSGLVDFLKGPVELKEGDNFANVQIILGKDTGTLKGSIVNAEKDPVRGMQVTLVPTDPARFKNSSYYRTVRSNEDGEFEVKLPPFEFAVLSLPPNSARRRRADLYAWLATAVTKAQTFKIEPGQTTKIVIRNDASKPPAK